MKMKLIGLALACGAASMGVAHASTTQGLTRAEVKAQLNQAFLNGTLPQDEGPTYPTPASDRTSIAAHRHYEEAHGRY